MHDTNSGGTVPRFHKLEFPKFDGTDDPLNWINHSEQFFWGQHTPDTDRVWMAIFHLTGAAQEWYFHYEQHKGPLDWDTFKELCYGQYGQPIRNNSLGELKRLTQVGTVPTYQQCFLPLASHMSDLITDCQQVQLFTAGLTDDICIDVELQQPEDLQEAMSLARAYEWKATRQQNAPRPPRQHALPPRRRLQRLAQPHHQPRRPTC